MLRMDVKDGENEESLRLDPNLLLPFAHPGERREAAAGLVVAAEGGLRDQDQALLAAVVGVRAPADVGEQAGGVAQAPLLLGLVGAGRLEQRIAPGTQLEGVLGGPRALARILGAE